MTLRQIILPAALLLSAAAIPAVAQEPQAPAPATPAAEAAPAAAPPAAPPAKGPVEASGRIQAPPEGKGQVVFFRPSSMLGMALSFSVREGDKGVAKLGNGSYAVHVADPGAHEFVVESEASDKLTLEIDPGETYYVKQTIGVGIVAGRPHLAPAEQGEFERLKLKLSSKTPSDKKAKAD